MGNAPLFPQVSADICPLSGDSTAPGLYFVLIRWHPGYMSAPHTYTTDRFCVVVSGAWWVNSGADFDPASCVPAPAGSFVHRVAGTPHYDGVIRSQNEPAVIAICGIGPVNFALAIHRNPLGGRYDRWPPTALRALVLVRTGCRSVDNRVAGFAVALAVHPQWNSEADIGAMWYAPRCP